jgi:CRISPR/Cas system-associated endonuclease Cas1
MHDIVVSDDFVKALAESGGEIRFLNAQGEVLGRFEPELTADELAEIRRRLASDEPRYTTKQMLERLGAKAAQ